MLRASRSLWFAIILCQLLLDLPGVLFERRVLHLVFPPLHCECYECQFITLNEKSQKLKWSGIDRVFVLMSAVRIVPFDVAAVFVAARVLKIFWFRCCVTVNKSKLHLCEKPC